MDDDKIKKSRELTRLRVERFRQAKRRKTKEDGAHTIEPKPEFSQRLLSSGHDKDNLTEHDRNETISDEVHNLVGEKPSSPSVLGESDRDNGGENNVDDNPEIVEENDEVHETDRTSDDSDHNVPSESGDNETSEEGETEELRKWAHRTKIPQNHLDDLLGILRKRLLPDLPQTAKTFLGTSSVDFKVQKLDGANNVDGGQLVYFGIAKYLRLTVNINLHRERILYLLFNIDGLPLFKSSSKQLWPILCKIHFEPDLYKPFPVAIYAGDQKPQILEQYFRDFILELNQLLKDGIEIDGVVLQIALKSFICDTPARSLIKCIIGHGGYYACERCIVKGERVEKRTIYPPLDSEGNLFEQRNCETFRRQENSEHHTGISPLLSVEPQIDMVAHFSLDFMHLCCLGVMKKMFMHFWLKKKVATQLSVNSKQYLSNALILLQSQIPDEFQRTTRSLHEISKWKATEFRFFLLYCGPILLKIVLPTQLYHHFMLFHAACRILCSASLALQFTDKAKQFFLHFVKIAATLYGKQCQVMNMHNLIHLADDVTNMGCSLSSLTAFPFESMLGKLKKNIRSGNRPLAQVCRRFCEAIDTDYKKVQFPPEIEFLKMKSQTGDALLRINKIKYKSFIISSKPPNNAVLFCDGMILEINEIYKLPESDAIKVNGKILRVIKSMFTYPCDSETFKMWQVKKTTSLKTRSLSSIDLKLVMLSTQNDTEEKMYVISLLH